MSDLIKALRAAAELDANARESAFYQYGVVENSGPADNYNKKADTFIAGCNYEHDRLAPILSRLIAVAEKAEIAHDYLIGFDCEKNCDSSVNFHEPECHMENDFAETLADLRAAVMPEGDK